MIGRLPARRGPMVGRVAGLVILLIVASAAAAGGADDVAEGVEITLGMAGGYS